jgi:hypothetical protein
MGTVLGVQFQQPQELRLNEIGRFSLMLRARLAALRAGFCHTVAYLLVAAGAYSSSRMMPRRRA